MGMPDEFFLADSYLESPRITDYGIWGPLAHCEAGTFVKGMILKIQKYQAADESALNAIRLLCGTHGSTNLRHMKKISSLEGGEGDWRDLKMCDGGELGIGFELRSDVDRGPNQEETAGAVGLRLICGGARREVIEDLGPYPWGSWTGPQVCPKDKAICGFRTQVEEAGAAGN